MSKYVQSNHEWSIKLCPHFLWNVLKKDQYPEKKNFWLIKIGWYDIKDVYVTVYVNISDGIDNI